MTPSREEKERGRETTPRLPETTPSAYQSGGDYSYMEIIMAMQNTMGRLTEAVESLKSQSKSHGEKLEEIGKDVHAAKIVGAFLVLVAGFLGFVIHELIPLLSSLKKP
jgi:hypothetical protein